MATVEEVILHYRHCVLAASQRLFRRPDVHDPQDVAIAREYMRWCAGHEIDPLFYITTRLSNVWHTKKFIVQFRSLRCESCVKPHKDREYQWRLSQASARAASTQESAPSQLVRDLALFVPNHEQVRSRYYREQHPALCRASAQYSGGYDPRSRFCPSCPEAAACANELKQRWGFDVVALRTGRFDQLPASIANITKARHGVSV